MSCEDCHAAGDADWSVYAKDNPRKQMARVMVTMMATINKTHFGGRQVVTCFTCHRGTARPGTRRISPCCTARRPASIRTACSSRRPTRLRRPGARQVHSRDWRRAACRRAQQLRRARHEHRLWTRERAASPRRSMRAPGQRTTIIHTSAGDSTTTFDGRAGWIAAPFRPVAVLALSDQDLDGLKLDADLAFPARHQAGADEVASRACPPSSTTARCRSCREPPRAARPRRSTSTWRRVFSVVRCATSIRRWAGLPTQTDY